MKRLISVVLSGALWVLPGCGGGAGSPGTPNVLLLVIDTIRADRLGCYGSTAVETPAMDRLAAEGALFENAFTQAAYTLPSICTILTSLSPYRHQVRANAANLDDRFTTIAELLKNAGYRTGAVIGSAVLDADRNISQGFDSYDDDLPLSVPIYSQALQRAGVGLGEHLQRRADAVTNRSIEWIHEGDDRPFFLLAHYFDPHSLYDPPPPFDAEYDDQPYDGEVAFTDQRIGVLLDALRSAGLSDNTLVVLVGDHGESLGDHGEPEHGFFVYDATIRVPVIFKLPGVVPPGSRIEKLVSTVDLLPTILDLLDLPPAAESDGRSLAGLIGGEAYDEIPVYSEAFSGYFSYGWAPTRSIRTRAWKYVEAPRKELYDLSADPEESENLYGTGIPAEEALEKEMRRHLRSESLVDPVEIKTDVIPEEHRQRLAALGYVSGSPKTTTVDFSALPDPKLEVVEFQNRQESRYFVFLARSFFKEGNAAKGEEYLRRARELTPHDPEVLAGLAAIHMRNGGFAEAEKLYRQVIETGPQSVEPYVDLAIAVNNQGRVADAVKILEECPEHLSRGARYPQLIEALRDASAKGRPLVIR